MSSSCTCRVVAQHIHFPSGFFLGRSFFFFFWGKVNRPKQRKARIFFLFVFLSLLSAVCCLLICVSDDLFFGGEKGDWGDLGFSHLVISYMSIYT